MAETVADMAVPLPVSSGVIGEEQPKAAAIAVPAGGSSNNNNNGESGAALSNNNEEDSSNSERIAALMVAASTVKALAKKYNPLEGVKSLADVSTKARREAKNLLDPRAFSKPKDRTEWMARISANTAYFRLTYSGMYALTVVYVILTSPFLLFELATLLGLWLLFFKVNKADDVITVGQYQLGRKEKMLVLVPLSLFVAFFGGLLTSVIYMALAGSFFVGLHASFRAPVEYDPLDELDDSAEDAGIPTAF